MAKSDENKLDIVLSDGTTVKAFAPVIVSASRSTDIPAFYADWFFNRLEAGYSIWTNPFNNTHSYVSYKRMRFVVFWSKNPYPLLKHLDKLQDNKIGCYVQFSLNDYENEGLEKGVPPLNFRINTFKQLVKKLGKGHVIWRFDPMILTNNISIDTLIEKTRNIGDQLKEYTEKMVFSFADILSYRKVKSNLDKAGINYTEWTDSLMEEFASRLSVMNKERNWNYTLSTCGEKIDLSMYGIQHNKCIDDDLIIRLAYNDAELMKYLNVEVHKSVEALFDIEPDDSVNINEQYYAVKQRRRNKDGGQRSFCKCIESKDIGQYNTCPHLCEYCYANTSRESALANYKKHKLNPLKESII